MKKLLLIILMLGLVGCKNNELRKYEQQTFLSLNDTFLDTTPPDTYTYRHNRSEMVKVDGVKYAKIYIQMTVSTLVWTPDGFIPQSLSWEQVYTYEVEEGVIESE